MVSAVLPAVYWAKRCPRTATFLVALLWLCTALLMLLGTGAGPLCCALCHTEGMPGLLSLLQPLPPLRLKPRSSRTCQAPQPAHVLRSLLALPRRPAAGPLHSQLRRLPVRRNLCNWAGPPEDRQQGVGRRGEPAGVLGRAICIGAGSEPSKECDAADLMRQDAAGWEVQIIPVLDALPATLTHPSSLETIAVRVHAAILHGAKRGSERVAPAGAGVQAGKHSCTLIRASP